MCDMYMCVVMEMFSGLEYTDGFLQRHCYTLTE